jgi:hypothetical protein
VRTIMISRWMLAGFGILAIGSVAACTAHPAGYVAGPPGSSAAASPATVATVSPSAAVPSPTLSEPGAENLVISSAEQSELTEVYAATYASEVGIPVSELGTPAAAPGSVYYAYDGISDIYWALASFHQTAPASDETAYMDGTDVGMFKKVGASPWQVTIPINPDICQELQFFPHRVLVAWALPTAPPPGVC